MENTDMNLEMKHLLTAALRFIIGFVGMIFLGISIVLHRIDLNIASNIAPFILLISMVMLYIFVTYKMIEPKSKLKSIIFSITIVLAASWICFAAALFFLQDAIIYQRKIISNERLESIKSQYENVEEINILSGEAELHGWYIKNNDMIDKSPLIIYFGGGAEEISKRIENFIKIKGWSTVLINYRGYGLSYGNPSEKNIFKDTLNIYDYFSLSSEIDRDRIVVMGRSLGTGAAVYLSDNRDVYKTILVSPYDSMTNWLQQMVPFVPANLVMKSPFDSLSRASSIRSQVLCIVGDKDKSVLPSQSERLISRWDGKYSLHTIKGEVHDTILYSEECWDAIRMFLEQ